MGDALFSALFTLINVAIRGGSIIYFFKYVVRDESGNSHSTATTGSIAFIAGAMSTRFFVKMGDRRS